MLKITVISLGNKPPSWVEQALADYSKRLSEAVHLTLVEIPLLKRGKSSDITRIAEKEAQLLKAAIPSSARVIALDLAGERFSSEALALKLERIQHVASHLCFLIGGPEGLAPDLLQQSQERWSLSTLTLPHTLARVVLLETLYRAWSILTNHPYHK